MIEKAIAYKNSDNEFIESLKKLGLSDKEIESILKKYKRKKFEGGGDGGGGDGGGDSGGGDGGDGGDSGDSGDAGDSGPGGSDDGTGHGGPGPGDAGMGAEGDTMGSSTAADAAANQAASEAAAQAASDEATIGMQQAPSVEAPAETGIMSTLGNLARTAFNAYTSFSPLGIAMTALGNITRGVTAPNDYSQATTSVQTAAPSTSTGGGGITTIQNYAPLTNTSTGDNTSDSIRTRLENLLKTQTVQIPTNQTVYQGQNINPLSNYTLLDLSNLRR